MESRVRSATIVFATALLAGCPNSSGDCQVDSDCGSDVCARTGECLPASDVRTVRTTWTIRGMPANAQTCAASPDLYIQFDGPVLNDTWGYEPVPCMAGLFTALKLPSRFAEVELGVNGGVRSTTIIDGSGNATFNLFP
jgi:hypothetical protein